MNKKKNIVVLYHKDCSDGFAGAWSAWKKFGNQAMYIATHPRTLPSKKIKNAYVYVIDNSLSLKDLELLRKQNCVITIIDHHEGSKNDILEADVHIFDSNHSGAMLAWKYFHPHKKIPRLITYIEDGDLWKFKFKETAYIQNMLRLDGFDFFAWDAFSKKLEHVKSRKEIIKNGKLIERYRKDLITASAKRAQLVLFEGHRVYAVNEPTEAIRSEVAHILYERKGPFSIVWSVDENDLRISLRAKRGVFDVTKIAKKYGGGGHPAAAGIRLPLNAALPWKPIRNQKKSVY